MIILGIDPGIAIVGYGVLNYEKGKFAPLDYGAIKTSSGIPTEKRIEFVFRKVDEIIKKYRPDCLAIEELFWNTNQKTGIIVAEARGVIILAAAMNGIPIYEYTPLQIKQSVVGFGRAAKNQVIAMVTMFLGLEKPPRPDDTADALAVAICHAHTGGSKLKEYYNKPTTMKGKIT